MRQKSYNNFWKNLHKIAREKKLPLRIMFELTYRCNFFCKHCYVPLSYRRRSEKEKMDTKEIFSILDQLADIGCLYLGFTGGEPFVREDFIDILWYAQKRGFQIIIYTNAYFIDKKIVNELALIRPNKVDITVPAMSKDVFERISGVVGSYERVFQAIEQLHKNGINLGFKSCVLKENISEIKNIEEYAHSLGVGYRLDQMLSPRLDGSQQPFQYRAVDLEEVDEQPPRTEHRELFNCGVGATQAAITPFGQLKMCVMIDYPQYNILKDSLQTSWNRLTQLVKTIKNEGSAQCDSCALESYCKWCPARAWLEHKSFTGCTKEDRRWAEKRKKSHALTG